MGGEEGGGEVSTRNAEECLKLQAASAQDKLDYIKECTLANMNAGQRVRECEERLESLKAQERETDMALSRAVVLLTFSEFQTPPPKEARP
jgi:hypothetical protein